jgi:tRNA-2-methylthio-N6-dimethylallyladenosine synthase
MKVYIETLGCQMNRLDSELLVTLLQRESHEIVNGQKQADVILYNTCSVRQHAEDKVYSRLGVDAKRKASGRNIIVGVLGCMVQREGTNLAKKYPAVDILCAPGQLYKLPDMIDEAAESGKLVVSLDPPRTQKHSAQTKNQAARDAEAMDLVDASRDPNIMCDTSQGFVRIMRGCDNFCTYCIVPFVRGPERSRHPQSIIEEIRKLTESGRSEITLLGQTVNSYRYDDAGTITKFSDLLTMISPIEGLRRLRFVTSHPVDFTTDILQVIRDLPNVCPYIHVPAQSGSDKMLKAMNRGYTRKQYDELIATAREMVPNVVLVSDFIVGFPGESQEDHEASKDLIYRSAFKNSFIFKYSPRPGTTAAKRLDDNVPEEIKKQRNNELLAVQKQVALAHHEQYIGKTVEVLVTGPSKRSKKQTPSDSQDIIQMMGRTTGDHIVIFNGAQTLNGNYVNIEITSANDLNLFGELAT